MVSEPSSYRADPPTGISHYRGVRPMTGDLDIGVFDETRLNLATQD